VSDSDTWYEVLPLGWGVIRPVQVITFTEKTLLIWRGENRKPLRQPRDSKWYKYFPTYAQARQHIVDEAWRAYELAQANLKERYTAWEKAQEIPEKEPAA
jgi:hypothetical protein